MAAFFGILILWSERVVPTVCELMILSESKEMTQWRGF